jgi:superfamily II RNA helicase
MIVSLLRVRDFEVEDMLRSSFAEFHAQKQNPAVLHARDEAAAKLDKLRENPWPEGPGWCVP